MNAQLASSTSNITVSTKEEGEETIQESFNNQEMDESLQQSLQDFKFDVECLQREKHLELEHERREQLQMMKERFKRLSMTKKNNVGNGVLLSPRLLSPKARISRNSLLSPRFKSPVQNHRRRSDILKSTLFALDAPLLSPQKETTSVSRQNQQPETNKDKFKRDQKEEHEKSLDRQFRRQVEIEDLKGIYRQLSARRIEAEAEADRAASANKAFGEESSGELSDVEGEEEEEHAERQTPYVTPCHSYTALCLTLQELGKLRDASPGILAEHEDSLRSSFRLLEEKRSEYTADLMDYDSSPIA